MKICVRTYTKNLYQGDSVAEAMTVTNRHNRALGPKANHTWPEWARVSVSPSEGESPVIAKVCATDHIGRALVIEAGGLQFKWGSANEVEGLPVKVGSLQLPFPIEVKGEVFTALRVNPYAADTYYEGLGYSHPLQGLRPEVWVNI